MNVKKIGFWGVLVLAFAPNLKGNMAAVQKAARVPVNLVIVGLFVPVFLLFTSVWWLGLILLAGWFYFTPKVVRKVNSLLDAQTAGPG